ncbi:MAG: hypothetical protein ACRDNS_28800 [Trebonia sp.]
MSAAVIVTGPVTRLLMVRPLPTLATTALLWAMAVAVPGASSVRVTVIASVPGEAKLCEPVTVKVPFEPFTVPAELPPSPQAMLALKSVAALAVSLSVKVATVTLLSAWPAVAARLAACGVSTSPSATTTVPVGVMVVPSAARVMATAIGSLPSSA